MVVLVASLAITLCAVGLLLGLAVFPERMPFERRALLAFALAIPATVLIALPGVMAGRLSTASTGVAFGALGALAALRWARARLRVRRAWPRPSWGSFGGFRGGGRGSARLGAAAWKAAVGAALLGLAALAVVWPQSARLPDGLPAGATAWYYWNLVGEMARTGGVPPAVFEWGAPHRFPVEYMSAIVHGAATAQLAGGGSSLGLMEAYRLAIAAGGLVAMYALFRIWFPRWWAFLCALMALSASFFAERFETFRPETVGFLLVAWSTWALDQALLRRSKRWGVVAALISATGLLAHAEAWLLTAPLWLGVAVWRVDPRRIVVGTTPTRAAARILATTLAALAIFSAGLGLATGTGGRLVGMVTGETAARAAGPAADGDPTWELWTAINGLPDTIAANPPPRLGRPMSIASLRWPADYLDLAEPGGRIALAALAALVLLACAAFGRRSRRALLAWGCIAAGILGLFLFLSLGSETYVPQRAGYGRILPYVSLAFVAAAGALGLLMARSSLAIARRAIPRSSRGTGMLVAAVPSVALLLAFTPLARPNPPAVHAPMERSTYDVYAWMRTHLPERSVVLVNAYTEGSVAAIGGMTGWIDGRAPYLESSQWRSLATRRLREARAFFREPSRGVPRGVDYVLAAVKPTHLGGSFFATDRRGLEVASGLEEIEEFNGGEMVLYRVRRGPP